MVIVPEPLTVTLHGVLPSPLKMPATVWPEFMVTVNAGVEPEVPTAKDAAFPLSLQLVGAVDPEELELQSAFSHVPLVGPLAPLP